MRTLNFNVSFSGASYEKLADDTGFKKPWYLFDIEITDTKGSRLPTEKKKRSNVKSDP